MSKKQIPQIPRRPWLMSVDGWYARSKKILETGEKTFRSYNCGYCLHVERGSCVKCPLFSKIGGCITNERSAYKRYVWSKSTKTQVKYALIIFRAIIAHGKDLGYITGAQRKQIAELEDLEKKMFGGKG